MQGSKGNYYKIGVNPGASLIHFTVKAKGNETVSSVISVRFNGYEVCENPLRVSM